VVPHSARQFARAVIMPNLKPPVTRAEAALAYRDRILAAVPAGVAFDPLMTLYLTDNLPADEIRRAKRAGIVAVKLYPAGATTNSDAGVTDLRKTYATLEAMQREGLPLLVHGEVADPEVDVFDRERAFIDAQLIPLRRDFPELKIVFEHITTRDAAQYVAEAGAYTAATITAHHLLYNRNAIFLDANGTAGLRPHYCDPHRCRIVLPSCSGPARGSSPTAPRAAISSRKGSSPGTPLSCGTAPTRIGSRACIGASSRPAPTSFSPTASAAIAIGSHCTRPQRAFRN